MIRRRLDFRAGNQAINAHHGQSFGGKRRSWVWETLWCPWKRILSLHAEYLRRKGGNDLVPVYLKPEGQEDFPIPTEMEYRPE